MSKSNEIQLKMLAISVSEWFEKIICAQNEDKSQ